MTHSVLGLRRDSDKLLELTHFWTPPVKPLPIIKKLNSSLRIAAIVSDHLYQGLKYECNLLLLTPENWKQVLRYGKPDFFLMESTWETCTGDWHMSQFSDSLDYDSLVSVIKYADERSIPTVFWNTNDYVHHEYYKDIIKHFNFVFCADPRESRLLETESVSSEILLPCVQPALYNPLRLCEDNDLFNLGVLFDGWADLDRLGDDLSIVNEINHFGLSIMESRYHLFRNRLEILDDYRENIIGCVDQEARRLALKYSEIYVTFQKTSASRTTQQWMTLEALASRLPVLHLGVLQEDDIRRDIVLHFSDNGSFLHELVMLEEDPIYRERVGHLGWRAVCSDHTFANRIKAICDSIGVNDDWVEFPKISIITPTLSNRKDERILVNFEKQIYPSKELIIVKHECQDDQIDGIIPSLSDRNDVLICHMPQELGVGACLNFGNIKATGKYVFRFDDDDLYGERYVYDAVLHLRSVDAQFFGKGPSPIYLSQERKVYWRDNAQSLCFVTPEMLKKGAIRIGGNTFGGEKDFFSENWYEESNYGAADSYFLLNNKFRANSAILLLDRLNVLAERSSDQGNHTWKLDLSTLKNKSESTGYFEDYFV